uniref:Uncharacterized protein n=1 Tax=Triticum urartu TaxID=4572 RepID=A0A8R7TUX7_TRIUA
MNSSSPKYGYHNYVWLWEGDKVTQFCCFLTSDIQLPLKSQLHDILDLKVACIFFYYTCSIVLIIAEK